MQRRNTKFKITTKAKRERNINEVLMGNDKAECAIHTYEYTATKEGKQKRGWSLKIIEFAA